MSSAPEQNPHLEHCLHHNGTCPISPKELISTLERPLIAAQKHCQRTPQQKLRSVVVAKHAKEIPEDMEGPSSPVMAPTQGTQLNLGNLDLQTLLVALSQQSSTQTWKRSKSVKELVLFSEGSPDKLWAFIF